MEMSTNFISGIMMIILIILMKMEKLFYNMKGIFVITRLLGTISTLLYVGSSSVFTIKKTEMIDVIWISFSAVIKWLIMVLICRILNEYWDN